MAISAFSLSARTLTLSLSVKLIPWRSTRRTQPFLNQMVPKLNRRDYSWAFLIYQMNSELSFFASLKKRPPLTYFLRLFDMHRQITFGEKCRVINFIETIKGHHRLSDRSIAHTAVCLKNHLWPGPDIRIYSSQFGIDKSRYDSICY